MSKRNEKDKTSRRNFLGAATVAGAALSAPAGQVAAASPFQTRVTSPSGTGTRAGIAIAPRTDMNSGAPLGGIGTGLLEIRPDGGFYEWQIFNSGAWAGRSGGPAAAGPKYLEFFVRTAKSGEAAPKLRRLYLRSNENNIYFQPFLQEVESIEYDAWFPMTGLQYIDSTLPVRLSAVAFSPFIPGKARESGTPGFHMVFTVVNTSSEPVEATLVSLLENPLLPDEANRMLRNSISHDGGATLLEMTTEAQPQDKSGVGGMCLSVSGGDQSWISGTFHQYAFGTSGSGSRGTGWNSQRGRNMHICLIDEIFKNGRLSNGEAARDPSEEFKLTADEIDALTPAQADDWIQRLGGDGMIRRVLADAQAADPQGFQSPETRRSLLKEIARNIAPPPVAAGGGAGRPGQRLAWGMGALASTLKLAPGQRAEVRFALSWFFPHHVAQPQRRPGPAAAAQPQPAPVEMGHMYANWFKDAGDVNRYLLANYAAHRKETETFARTLADTSLGDALAFAWSSQLSTLVKSTWWIKDGGYAIWEGLGCCGHSTTDVDYQGNHPLVALFPELRLGQSRRMIQFQNERGQVPHFFTTDLDHVDNGFNRVDMNPQYVMMVCRDYLWTGDKAYLEDVWPHIAKAMEYTASLDTNGDGLPDKNTGFQTYDLWSMRGTPSYIASLWIGGLRAAIRIAAELGHTAEAARWKSLLEQASASFDRLLFNGEYYRLWVDGDVRSELCMSDQLSGEWFTRLIGLPGTISEKNLAAAVESIVKHNFTPEFGLHNATAPKGGNELLMTIHWQAGAVWTGIEFAFAAFLMDQGRFGDGARIVEAVHRRYMRAGRPWNHLECGDHYSRSPSSWTTLLAATGFKPDWPSRMLTVAPKAPGDFHAPWVMASGFGRIARSGPTLSIAAASGKLTFQVLQVNAAAPVPVVRLAGRTLNPKATREGSLTRLEFAAPVSVEAGQTLVIS
jgi:uncharacterized protein (DUF608 family)